jgi:hypothetical protein
VLLADAGRPGTALGYLAAGVLTLLLGGLLGLLAARGMRR